MIVSVMFSGVIIYMREHLDWLYSAQLVACLAHVAVNTLVNLYVDLRCLRRFAGIYADLLETKNGGDQ